MWTALYTQCPPAVHNVYFLGQPLKAFQTCVKYGTGSGSDRVSRLGRDHQDPIAAASGTVAGALAMDVRITGKI